MLDCIAIIPARFASTRLPGKPLKKIGGKSIVQRVYENIKSAELFSEVIVATDDERIAREVENFKGNYIISKSKHHSGSDRIAEIAQNLDADIFFNIQSDELQLNTEILSVLSQEVVKQEVEVATPIFHLKSKEVIFNPNQVKAVIDKNNFALYFSRSVIPYNRSDVTGKYWGHIGIYAYTKEALMKFYELDQSWLEKAEKLEQLRLLENGFSIKTVVCDYNGIAIDTPDDLKMAREIYNKNKTIKKEFK